MVIERVNTKIHPGLGRSKPIQTPKFIELFSGGIFRKSKPPQDINPPTKKPSSETLEIAPRFDPHQHNVACYKAIQEKVLNHQKRQQEEQAKIMANNEREEFYKEASKELAGFIVEAHGGKILHQIAFKSAFGILERVT